MSRDLLRVYLFVFLAGGSSSSDDEDESALPPPPRLANAAAADCEPGIAPRRRGAGACPLFLAALVVAADLPLALVDAAPFFFSSVGFRGDFCTHSIISILESKGPRRERSTHADCLALAVDLRDGVRAGRCASQRSLGRVDQLLEL